MDDVIGTAQVTRPTSGTMSPVGQVFIGRWVSPVLGSATTQIDANTWTLNFAATDAGSNRFPVTGSNAAMHVCAYVWRPGTGKVADILDGSTSATYQVGITTEKVEHGTFSGALVTGVQTGDVICVELWADTTGAGGGWAVRVYFDGTTENTTGGATVSNHASFIETPQTLALPIHVYQTLSETVDISENQAVLRTKTRPLTTETVNIAENIRGYYLRPLDIISVSDTVDKLVTQVSGNHITKTLSDTVNISAETLARLSAKLRPITTQTITISEPSLTKLIAKVRPLTETVSISETLARLKLAKRTSTDTVTTSETIDRLKKAIRILSTETVAASEDLTRIKSAIKAITDSITILAGTLARLSAKVRTFTETITVPVGTLTILREKIRTVTDTLNISDAVDRQKITGAIHISKTLTETAITVSDGLDRLLSKIRTVTDTIDVTSTLVRKLELTRILSETVNKAETLARKSAKVRVSTDTIAISSSLTTLLAKIRTAIDTIAISDAVDRVTSVASLNVVRSITESAITITDGLTKLLAKIRTVTDTVPITTSLSRLTSKIRTLSDTVSKSETLTRISAKVKALATETVSSSESISRLLAKIRARTETITISDFVNQFVQGPAKHLVRIIEELDIAVSDYFYKSRVLDTETIEVTDFVEITVIQPINNIIEIIEEPISIADNVTFVAPFREVVMTLAESTDIGEGATKISGKVRRIGGPG